MKDPYQVLRQKETDIERVRKEIEALHFVIPLLAEDADWIANGWFRHTLAVSRKRNCGGERGGPEQKGTQRRADTGVPDEATLLYYRAEKPVAGRRLAHSARTANRASACSPGSCSIS
jgi:hypothetical protein